MAVIGVFEPTPKTEAIGFATIGSFALVRNDVLKVQMESSLVEQKVFLLCVVLMQNCAQLSESERGISVWG